MLRFLMQAAAGIATFNLGQKIAAAKRSAVYFAVAGVIVLLGLGALVAAAIIWLEPRLGLGFAGAAAAVGGGLLLVAGLVGWVGSWKPKRKAPTPIFERVRAEVGAAGAAMTSARAARTARPARADEMSEAVDAVPRPPLSPGARRKRAANLVLIATIAGVILGRRL